ncbi:glycosyltransferase family 39 protein [Pontibacter akesuensis]|uniref:Dolichyl-phosphate-mannose-protein mannosyltransferase n=1 Tax=Pontibacter akesuensis TaxID=388950 RepID=A0A1I7GHR1_9BACT|nr:glycosyltransferase family 39 protein [Pontibacter akesuensis]GHA56753.1 hypothetical protein GCM10007389_05480 [Pontibacter akesuensis]SFU48000.1 Dolichyl-phosphate-mannose-protein mannosyltransferase [Pontibacter akesuensis]
MHVFLKSPHPEVSEVAVAQGGEHSAYNWKPILWALLAFGVFLRLFHFFDNRSLYIDELFLGASLVKMSFAELAQPMLEYEQKAPLGYLWMSRLAVVLFGTGEMALRLFPLLCGLASLFVFLPVARYFLRPLGVVVAVGVLAAAPPIVYHAVEAKQYSTEFFATVLILYLYIRFHDKKDIKSLLLWGLSGAVILWFSFASIFVLAGMAFGVCLSYIFKRDWQLLFRAMIPFSMWLFSFALNYFLFIYQYADSEWLMYWFEVRNSFMPLPPTSVADLKWFFLKAFSILHHPLGLSWYDLPPYHNPIVRILSRVSVFPLIILGVGLVSYFKKDRRLFMILLFPLLLTMLASGLRMYPFMDRLLIFLAPLLIIFVAQGSDRATRFFPASAKWRYLLPALLLLGPLANSTNLLINTHLFGEYKKSFQRETLSFINERYQEGDVVYIYWNNLVGYRFYKDTEGLKYDAIEGNDYRTKAKNLQEYYRLLDADIAALKGNKRVWLVYSNGRGFNIGDFDEQPTWYYTEDNTRKILYDKFDAMGNEVDSFLRPDVNVHLFKMEKKLK